MKIALIQKHFLTRGGGAEQYAVNLASGLVRHGHDVHVFAHRRDTGLLPGVTFCHVPMIKTPSSLQTLSFVKNTQQALSSGHYDIIQGLSRVFPQDVYRMSDGIYRHWLKVKDTSPAKRFVKRCSPRNLAILWVEKQIFARNHYRRIISNSNLCEAHAVEYYGVDPSRIKVIRNGIDFDRFNPGVRAAYRTEIRKAYQLGESEVVILFASMNYVRKGLIPLMRSFARVCKTHRAKLLVVGRGAVPTFRRLASRLDIDGNVIFANPTAKIEQYYGSADFFVLPTYYDPCANVCLEALACGLPVVTTRSNGASELIQSGKNGRVIDDPEDLERLSQALLELMEPRVRIQMQTHAAESVQHLTVDDHITRVCCLYQEIVREKFAKNH